MQYPIVTLLTDFGASGPYVAAMKGVILKKCAQMQPSIVDIAHSIEKFNIVEGGLVLRRTWKNFPDGTIHVCVVDPTVGSDRRIICCRYKNQLFLAPDNGFLPIALNFSSGKIPSQAKFVGIDTSNAASSTFHGRDIFAPSAARLACGEPYTSLGDRIGSDSLVSVEVPHVIEDRDDDGMINIAGQIIYFDDFGNAVTNIASSSIPKHAADVFVNGKTKVPFVNQYGDVDIGAMLAIIGSDRSLEISINQGNAKEILSLAVGDPISVRCEDKRV